MALTDTSEILGIITLQLGRVKWFCKDVLTTYSSHSNVVTFDMILLTSITKSRGYLQHSIARRNVPLNEKEPRYFNQQTMLAISGVPCYKNVYETAPCQFLDTQSPVSPKTTVLRRSSRIHICLNEGSTSPSRWPFIRPVVDDKANISLKSKTEVQTNPCNVFISKRTPLVIKFI